MTERYAPYYIEPGKIQFIPKKYVTVTLEELKALAKKYGRKEIYRRLVLRSPDIPFTSDGCSMWPDRWGDTDLYACCFWHDVAYWLGGTWRERLAADWQLAKDVRKLYSLTMAAKMFAGVVVGGHPVLFNWAPWKWGYGWK